jgi:hypothetical protein
MCILAVVGSPLSARSDVVCIKTSGKTPTGRRPKRRCLQQERGDSQQLRCVQKPARRYVPGARRWRCAAHGNIQIASPVNGAATAAARTATALAPATAIGDSNHFCVGGGFPGQAGSQFALHRRHGLPRVRRRECFNHWKPLHVRSRLQQRQLGRWPLRTRRSVPGVCGALDRRN